jgi:hypothetical protein
MGFYTLVGAVSLVLLPLAYKRSGSMTRYVPMTGAPVVWLLLMVAAVSAAISEASGAQGTSQAVFSGGLIGTALVQVVLLRRGVRGRITDAGAEGDAGRRPHDAPDP